MLRRLYDWCVAAAGKPYAPIGVTVIDTTTAVEEDCADLDVGKLGSTEIKVVYRWDATKGKYLPDSDAMTKLAAENEKRL